MSIQKVGILYNNIEEVNTALGEIEALKQSIIEEEAKHNKKEAERKQRLAERLAQRKAKLAELADGLHQFAIDNKTLHFSDTKTLELTNGSLHWQLGKPKLEFLKGYKPAQVLESVKESKHAKRFINIKESLDKTSILSEYKKQLITDSELRDISCTVTQGESFTYKTNSAVNTAKAA